MTFTIVVILTLLLMLLGIVGIIVPAIPGIPLIFLGMLLFGWGTHWSYFGWQPLVWWGLVAFASLFIDYYATVWGAKKLGASTTTSWIASLAAVAGFIFFNFLGLILFPFITAIMIEFFQRKSLQQAISAGFGTLVGFLAGTLFKILLGILMVGSFIMMVFF